MKQTMKKMAAVWMAVVLALALTACGGSGEDTTETVQNTVNQLQEKMTAVMSDYQNTFSDMSSMSDPSQFEENINKAIEMIDTAINVCDTVDAPGPDSQKYRDACKGLFELFKDMMNDLKGIDVTDSSAITEISSKYTSELMTKVTDISSLAQELVQKYNITMPTTTMN